MERKRRKNSRLTDAKRNIIASLIQEYDIQSADDLQDALKDLLGDTIQEMMEAEMTEHLGYDEYERSDSTNSRMVEKLRLFVANMAKQLLKFLKIEMLLFNLKLLKNVKKIFLLLMIKSFLCMLKV